jgi:hypothetical protein
MEEFILSIVLIVVAFLVAFPFMRKGVDWLTKRICK